MKILILTGNRLRHRYFAKKLLEAFSDVSLIFEEFKEITGDNYTNDGTTPLMAEHFQEFDRTEQAFFETSVDRATQIIEGSTIHRLAPDTINESENVQKIINLKPDIIVVYSTSILKKGIINAFPKRIFNLHAGLSPYYRGGGTNFFPFYNNELEYVGMTVHYLDAGIDSGDIILQGTPEFEADDNTHTIGCKCIDVGAELMIKVISRLIESNNDLPSFPQDLSIGRVYMKKHFTDKSILKVRRNLKDGLIENFLENQKVSNFVRW